MINPDLMNPHLTPQCGPYNRPKLKSHVQALACGNSGLQKDAEVQKKGPIDHQGFAVGIAAVVKGIHRWDPDTLHH